MVMEAETLYDYENSGCKMLASTFQQHNKLFLDQNRLRSLRDKFFAGRYCWNLLCGRCFAGRLSAGVSATKSKWEFTTNVNKARKGK